MSDQPETFLLTLQAEPGWVIPGDLENRPCPGIVRLRVGLKYLLRRCGLRCIRLQEITDVTLPSSPSSPEK